MSSIFVSGLNITRALLTFSEGELDKFISNIRYTLIAAQFFVLFLIGFVVAGAFASYFYVETMTADQGFAALVVAGEFLALLMLTFIAYTIVKKRGR